MPADVIERVEKLAGNKVTNRITFGNRSNEDGELDEEGDVITLRSDDDTSESDEESVTDAESIASEDGQEAPLEGHADYSAHDARDGEGRLHGSPDARRGMVATKIEPNINSETEAGGAA